MERVHAPHHIAHEHRRPALAGTPTVLATLGVWRVAHPALSKASRAVTGFASNVGRRFKKITPFWGR